MGAKAPMMRLQARPFASVRGVLPCQPCWARASPSEVAMSCSADTADTPLLQWLTQRGARPLDLKVELNMVSDIGQRGVLATDDLEPGSVVFSLPFDQLFIDPLYDPSCSTYGDYSGIPTWGGRLALRLLRARHAALEHPSGVLEQGSLEGWMRLAARDAAVFGTWLTSLPAREALLWPPGDFSAAEMLLLEEPTTVAEVQLMARDFQESWEAVKGDVCALGLGFPDWQWANAVIHSRCFVLGADQVHMTAPGIDMVNHAGKDEANAAVRMLNSPSSAQGVAAVAEVCEPPAPEPNRFELVVGDDVVPAGTQVTFSYGDWPNDVFVLLFGFVPRANPADSIVLFSTFEEWLGAATSAVLRAWDVAQKHSGHVLAGGQCPDASAVMDRIRAAVLDSAGGLAEEASMDRLTISAGGFDSRVLMLSQILDGLWMEAARFVCYGEHVSGAADVPLGLRMLVDRIDDRLAAFRSISDDASLLHALEQDARLSEVQLEVLRQYVPEDIGLRGAVFIPGDGNDQPLSATKQLALLGLKREHVSLAVRFRSCKHSLLQAAKRALPSPPAWD